VLVMYDHVFRFKDRSGRPPVSVSELPIEEIKDMLNTGDASVDESDPPGTTKANLIMRLEIELLIRQRGWR